MTPGRIALLSFLLIWLALHLSGVHALFWEGSFSIAPWDVLTLPVFALWLFYAARGRVKVSRDLIIGLFLMLLFCTWIGIEAFRSPQPMRGLSMYGIMLRNVVLFLVVGTLLGEVKSLRKLNRTLFLAGAGIAVAALVLFFQAAGNMQRIAFHPSLWRPGIGYVLDQGGVMRLVGFAEDPNFYSIYMALPLLIGFSLLSRKRWLGIGVIGLSLVLANSRTFYLVFAMSSLLLLAAAILFRQGKAVSGYLKSIGGSVLAIGIAAWIWSLWQGDLLQMILKRFDLLEKSGRFELWDRLLANGTGDFWLGKGLRGSEQLLGGMYSHNSYLDLLVETGFVGLVLWGLFALFVSLKALQKLALADRVPWVQMWFLLLPMMFAFSFLYNPFFWLLAAVLTADAGGERDERAVRNGDHAGAQ
ncbi:O-antigen ligase family protein [Tumebacillus avium]|uniref:O-antigen ligase family protein n=1 Tax=Tumebacillus avium TaxID=1903704 RepID=UPI0012FE38FB|nr:O-antigen ligase family protein [Tumebacillus avium]